MRGACSANRPKLTPPCEVAVDGDIEGLKSEREVDEPGASAENSVENSEEKEVPSKVLRNMDEMEWLSRNTQTAIQRSCPERKLRNWSHVHEKNLLVTHV